ncbi:MAG: T9SS type A sorting domain-containing protein [Flavobacteriales bacterium]
MKKVYILFSVFLLQVITAHAQWTYDPQNPKLVSDQTCVQSLVQQVSDGNGGSFVFWLDSRSGCNGNTFNDIFGQHYDSDGNELWEAAGREILSYQSSILSFAVLRPSSQEGILIGAHSKDIPVATDSLRFQKLNDDGVQLWANDLLVAKADGCVGNYFLGFENFSFQQDEFGYTVNFTPTYCGGSDGCRLSHFTTDGLLTGLFDGEPEGNQYYIGSRGIDRTYDGTGDTYLYYTGGNGAGAHAFVMRVTAAGDSAWAPIDVLEGTNGLNYKYAVMSDPDGVTIAYESTGEQGYVDIFMRRLNPDGSWAWNGDIIEVCTADGHQSNFYWTQDEDFIYIDWSDSRPGVVGNAAVYAQKVNKTTGEVQWQADGVEVFDQPTYITHAKCVLRDDGKLLVLNQSGLNGFNAQLLNENGETEWDAIVSLSDVGLPFYADYQMLNSNGNIIVAWAKSFSGGGADGIYIANVEAPAVTIEETISACNSYTSNGETFTESGVYTQILSSDTTLLLNLTINTANIDLILDGNTMEAQTNEGFIYWLDCADNSIVLDDSQTFTPDETGYYALMVNNNDCIDTSNCYLIEIISVNEIPVENFYSIYPNPGNDQLTLQSYSGFTNATIQIADATGRIVSLHNAVNGVLFTTNTKDLPVGVYTLQIQNRESSNSIVWIKN